MRAHPLPEPVLPRPALFLPLLAGGNLRDRSIAGLAAIVGVAIASLLSAALLGPAGLAPLLVAPIGASAVLLFAVPASPLAQPWSIVGGNMLSALVGVVAARMIPDVSIAAGVAVGGAILVMSLARCLHPPGGAAALTAVIGGPVVAKAGFLFPFLPVALNSALLLATGWAFHRVSGHSYPHRPAPAPIAEPLLTRADIDSALEQVHETFDIAREDLDTLLGLAEAHAAARRKLPK
jgi:CBS domain-containing membrane protein